MDERDGETYTFVRNIWKEPPRFVDEDVGPVAFLVHNTSKITVIVCPGCGGLSAEALNTAEGRVLDDDYTHGSRSVDEKQNVKEDGARRTFGRLRS